jgi:hypothetical protein
MNVVAELTLGALTEQGASALPVYSRALAAACEALEPPFGRISYVHAFHRNAASPDWVVTYLVANSIGEGEGARHLWDMAACTRDTRVAAQVQTHALDEARHARAYLRMLDIAFPGALDGETSAKAQSLVPALNGSPLVAREGAPFAFGISVDELIQMNIGEIRTRIHQMLQRPVLLAYCDADDRPRLERILDSLLLDETRHIAYTAQLIEHAARHDGAEQVMELMHLRLKEFSGITDDEVGNAAFCA